jgi:arginyl-tRNA synthetase
VEATIAELRRHGLVYEGRLPPPKGQPVEDWEDRQQTLFRATRFGDDIDRPLLKSDGSFTYFASDIAYHRSKFERGFLHMIDVWGADHGGYVKRAQAAVRAVSGEKADLDVKIVQLVKLLRGGEPVKMSKRAGDFVTLADVVNEVGKDVVRFMMLTKRADTPLDFDFMKVVEASKDNPVFYVQYAHARISSLKRKAADAGVDLNAGPDLSLLDEEELALVKRAAQYQRVIESAALTHEPHRIAFYLYDLASDFHALWNRGNDDPSRRFLVENNPQLSRARLELALGIAQIIRSGLGLMGVAATEEMR